MPHHDSIQTDSWIERWRTRLGHRLTGIVAALLLEAVLLILLLTLGQSDDREEPLAPALTTFDARDPAEPVPEPETEEAVPEPDQPEQSTPERATEPVPSPPVPQAPAPAIPPMAIPVRPAPPAPPPPPRPVARPTAPPDTGQPAYGPPNRGGTTSTDSQRVGTAPGGEPLYAARWYREPTDGELAGYLSTAQPGWGLIACRTAPDFRVVDCVAEGETAGSQLGRAVLAAAWQFRVRPPRVGGRDLIGGWVRIRIDYTQTRR